MMISMANKMSRPLASLPPSALACGILYDEKRVLFLTRKMRDGSEELILPCVEAKAGDNQAALLQAEFNRATGIDAHIVGAELAGTHNWGTRRRKIKIPAIAFTISAKNSRASPSSDFSGFKWLTPEDAARQRLSRKIEWLFTGMRVK